MGLYDDEKQSVETGDVLDVLYWQTKFASLKFEQALKTRQPEGAIKFLVPDVINSCTEVLKTYPNHRDVRSWMDHAIEIQKKIDPNAPAADFKGNFLEWRDYSYEAGWRSYHIARMAADDQDWSVARMHSQEAVTQFSRTVDRMADWPDDVQRWVQDARTEMESLFKTATAKS